MSLRSLPVGLSPEGNRPEYLRGERRDTWVAAFPSGARVTVSSGRDRGYPGLASVSPPTRIFYEAIAESRRGMHALDLGAGSGEGAAMLGSRYARVTGVELCPAALAYAKEFAPGVEWVLGDVCADYDASGADVATFVDVLGHVSDPVAALRFARKKLTKAGSVIVAEPRAYPTQLLRRPQRRAFDRAQLQSMLTRGGFKEATWVSDAGTFFVLQADVDTHPASERLLRALEQLSSEGSGAEVRHELESCVRSGDLHIAVEARLALARAALVDGDGDVAGQQYLEVRRLRPELPAAWGGLAELSLLAGDLNGAWQLAVEALNRSPGDPEANRIYARIAQQLGDPQAVEAWIGAHRLAPDDLMIATYLARAGSEEGDYRVGIDAFERVASYEPSHDEHFAVTFAWLLLMDNRVSEAVSWARRATIIRPESQAVAELWQALEPLDCTRLPRA